ncbi:MAG: galactose-1-epimerase [Ignavibacteriae bacterium]|nr:MAG: galactose-1-epimerase [Ignavibacteriota bacterium]
MNVKKSLYGNKDSQEIYLYTLTNKNGMIVSLTNYGGIITEIIVKDKYGKFSDVTLGFDSFEKYLNNSVYFGAIVGRCANRIANSKFTIDDVEYKVTPNVNPHHLHGGEIGFDQKIWEAESFKKEDEVGVILRYFSKNGEEGYPGNLKIKVIYCLNNKDEIKIDFFAETDKSTHINLTNHTYFNLKDAGKTPVYGHELQINADSFMPMTNESIVTGEIVPVQNTPFDLTKMKSIGLNINSEHEQIKIGRGFDHNFVLNGKNGELKEAAKVFEPTTGRILKVLTTEPGVQFYAGNYLDETLKGKHNTKYFPRAGFCLETQHFPNTPNNPSFPKTLLSPGEKFNSTTIFKFGLEK